MADLQMGPIESRFADIIWQNEPLSSAELAKPERGGAAMEKDHVLHGLEAPVR